MTASTSGLHVPVHPVRFVTAAALFDGHDAAINIMRRILQSQGAEVVHLGHNRGVDEVVRAAVQEDAQGVAISSYQGGHVEYFEHLVDRLREVGCGHVQVFGGGGGVIVAEEIDRLHAYGVAHLFSPEDGQQLGLARMVNTLIEACDVDPCAGRRLDLDGLLAGVERELAWAITAIENDRLGEAELAALRVAAVRRAVPVLGITGTGGAGKSSLTDELVLRARLDDEDKLRIAVLAVDPTRRRGGGALLGDRIRMNAIDTPNVFFRSLATRGSISEVPDHLSDVVVACRAAGYDLVIVETPGIGQGDSAVTSLVDVSLYVMTPEFGAASQLEKIDMLDLADVIAINKFDRRGGEDALRDVRRQFARNRELFGVAPDELPVYGTVASRFNDDGTTALYRELRSRLEHHGLPPSAGRLPATPGAAPSAGARSSAGPWSGRESAAAGPSSAGASASAAVGDRKASSAARAIVPTARVRYLADVAATVRGYHERTGEQAAIARRWRSAAETADALGDDPAADAVRSLAERAAAALDPGDRSLLDAWPDVAATYQRSRYGFGRSGDQIRTENAVAGGVELVRTSLAGTELPRVALPRTRDAGDLLRWLRSEHLPGFFPFTAGVFPFKREGEEPARMFAGEGDAARTNRRFHLLADGQPATRLSTAFDSVTLYGFDPDERPDVYGKVGTSGVSICTLDEMKRLFEGFDLCDPSTSVSMTINGPAPTILAMFLNTVIDQQVDRFVAAEGREPTADERDAIADRALRSVRGTVQADILKEDQGQNTCIFSTEFSLGLMGDVQQWFIDHHVRNFYSVSISGYHIAEAGANPITQLAFTLANGFTYVEAYLARGMDVDDFAPNLSFFFSFGMDPEYAVLGRVARRIWAVAMRDRYGANERSQKLKYHVQTSGRSLHAQEMAFNDIRTTLQALGALYDNCNSLHTNAFDEAVTTPSADSVRRALAIQLIINREWGLAGNENPLQGSFVIEELTDLVEEAVLAEFDRISERGGVLGAMEIGYQRGRIQDESMLYETRKHDGSLPIVGVNTFRGPESAAVPANLELVRGTDVERQGELARLREFQARGGADRDAALDALRQAALRGDNLFAVLMTAVRSCSLGDVTKLLFDVGGRYRRNV